MPHLTIEYSANVADHHDIDTLVEVVHHSALNHGLAALDALRTRAVARHHYRVADGGDDLAFIAITARIGPGRDPDTKTSFLQQVLDAAQRQVQAEAAASDDGGNRSGQLAIAWSMEVQEIDAGFRINRNEVRDRLRSRSPGVDQPSTTAEGH